MERLLVTGGARFIGSTSVHHVITRTDLRATVRHKPACAASEVVAGLPRERVEPVVGDIAAKGQ